MLYTRSEAIAAITGPNRPFELIDGDVWGRRCRIFRNAPSTLRDIFEASRCDAPFIVYHDERYTFEDTWQMSSRIARLLIDGYHISPGDRVAISMRNYPEWAFCFNAITSIGAIAVAMNALWQSEEMEFGLNDCGARVLFADQERVDRMAPFLDRCSASVITVKSEHLLEGMRPLSELLEAIGPVEMPDQRPEADSRATILYTSGSTGHPKGAVSSHRNIISALGVWEAEAHIGAYMVRGDEPAPATPAPDNQPATLLGVPLFHATGSHAVMLQSYRPRRKMVSMYKWDVEEAARLIEAERITSFVGPATMTGDLVAAARRTNRDLSTLTSVGGGGAPRAPEQVRSIASTFKGAMPGTGWGMTETNAIGTGIGGQQYLQRPGSSGRAACMLELRILDETGNELPAGQRGELQIRGASIIEGYWKRPEANAEAFDGDWLRTGDVAYLDEEGYLFIVDRIKDLVIRGGENIGCAQVEGAIVEYPGVHEASVYAVPDERLGEELGATLYCTEPVDPDALRDFLSQHLARFEIPRYIEIVSEPLPRIASGKINKRQLRDEAVGKFLETTSAAGR